VRLVKSERQSLAAAPAAPALDHAA
jgi:hypothetical protein